MAIIRKYTLQPRYNVRFTRYNFGESVTEKFYNKTIAQIVRLAKTRQTHYIRIFAVDTNKLYSFNREQKTVQIVFRSPKTKGKTILAEKFYGDNIWITPQTKNETDLYIAITMMQLADK